ncbi:trypsin-like serine peptidase [Dongia rigui]|uniref:Trypsin-like serine protease n=1 Tax=Dongia rigui TaxID=940149 RepID=A0ABU5DU44_9PROT|nr:trypsin-like serine protease [Dongia rigui]MDY0870822.1 trypsin-like serine protease [Dongia rigui]
MTRLFPTHPSPARAACLILFAALMAGCTTPVRTVDRPSGPLPWSAAIGRLDAEDGSCSATLVKPDVILTASHCLYGRGSEARITDFQFTPALDVGRERLKPAKVTAVIDMGWPIKSDNSGKLRGEPKDDWAVLRISPAVTYLEPMKVEKLSVDAIDARIKNGAKLSHAGYGVYGAFSGKRLQVRDNCYLVTDADKMLKVSHDVIVNRCEVIPGDSGGPIMLTDPRGARVVVGVVTNLWGDHGQKDFVSFGPASIYFADKIGAGAATTSAQ